MQGMSKKNQTPPKNFEAALEELEKILTEIESGGIGLEENLLRYERGTFLIQHCRGVLNSAEKQIELLSKTPDGRLASEPMAEDPPV
jgi:exodeoxyribonuclease VII small subunit